jgi:hypothetical protein
MAPAPSVGSAPGRQREVVAPALLWSGPSQVLRTRDLGRRYSRPAGEARRLAVSGVLRRVAHGYWLVPPVDRVQDPHWRPEVEALALALAVADYGADTVALMGASAARALGALPRAVAVGVVAVPRQRRELTTPYGTIRFVTRDVGRLQLTRARTELADGYTTDVEQTMLDLEHRRELGGVAPADVDEAVAALSARADWDVLRELAADQRLGATARRVMEAHAPT